MLLVNGQKMSKSLGNVISLVDILKEYDGEIVEDFSAVYEDGKTVKLDSFRLSSCFSKNYPDFGEAVMLPELCDISVQHPDMMDCFRYETEFELPKLPSGLVLKIENMSDGAEVFLNGVSCGRRIAPQWVYNLTKAAKAGKNSLRIEMLATAARKVAKFYPPKGPVFSMDAPKTICPEGILGPVRLFFI
jgi:hypothetical protein